MPSNKDVTSLDWNVSADRLPDTARRGSCPVDRFPSAEQVASGRELVGVWGLLASSISLRLSAAEICVVVFQPCVLGTRPRGDSLLFVAARACPTVLRVWARSSFHRKLGAFLPTNPLSGAHQSPPSLVRTSRVVFSVTSPG